jgi:protein-disulfide isomerase
MHYLFLLVIVFLPPGLQAQGKSARSAPVALNQSAACDKCSATEISKDGNGDVVARVNGQPITQDEVDNSIKMQLYNMQEKIYGLRKSALNSLIIKLLLENEAKQKGMSSEELKKSLVPEKLEVKQSEIDQIYSQNAAQFANLSEDEAKQKIKIQIEGRQKFEKYQAALADIRNKAKIEIFLPEPSPPVIKISDEGPSRGPKKAPVTVIEVSDFECPFCKQVESTLKQLLPSYGDRVRLIYKHFPLPNHQHAFQAAQAAVCAGEQGKFWEYHDLLFERSGELSATNLSSYAGELGLNVSHFTACLDSESSRAAVSKDIEEIRQVGLSSTPTFIINGRVLTGARNLDEFKSAIEQELKQEEKPAKSTPN